VFQSVFGHGSGLLLFQVAFDKLCEGGSFIDVCEVLATLMSEDEVPLRAAGLLKGWITQGLISGIR